MRLNMDFIKNTMVVFYLLMNIPVFSQVDIQNSAINYLTRQVGKSFYNKHITYNEKYSNKKIQVFNLSVQQTPDITKLIVLHVNDKMVIDTTRYIITKKQLKKCTKNPDKCNLPMNENTAIEIAKKEGFGQDISQWNISFIDDIENKNYKWYIRKTRNKSPKEIPTKYDVGDVLLIHAITGKTEQTIWMVE